jgi:hypothetical protein
MALLESEQIARFIVGDAVDPAAVEDADPLEGESAESGLVLHAASLASGVEGVGPERARDGLAYPLDEGLAEEGGALIAPVDGGFVAAAFGDGGNAGVLLDGGGVWEALTALAEGDEEAWSEGCASAWQGAEEGVVGQLGGELADLVVEAVDGSAGGAELGEQDVDEQEVGLNGSGVGGQRQLLLDGADAAIDRGLISDVMRAEEGCECLASGALDELEGGPALDEVGENGSLFVAEPAEHLGKVRLQGRRDAVGDPDAILDQGATSLDETSKRAHGHALGLEAGELVGVSEQELQGELGVGGVVLGAASGERCAVASEGLGLDGEDDEEVVLEECGDDWTLAELDTNGDGSATKSGAELVGPVTEGRWGGGRRSARAWWSRQRKGRRRASCRPSRCRRVRRTERVSAWGILRYNEGAGHAEPDPAKAIRRAGESGCP